MKPRRGFALSLLAACGIHAVVLLLPRAAIAVEPPIPTIELDLAAVTAAVQGGPAVTQAPARRAPASHTAQEPQPAPAEAAPPEALHPPVPTEPPAAAVSAPEPAGAWRSQGADTVSAGENNGASGATPDRPAPSAAPAAGTGAGGGLPGTPAVAAVGLVPPRPRAEILPTYPRSARRAGFEGLVKVAATIDASGSVTAAEVAVSSGHASLDQAALEAVRRALFAPALQEGRPVPCRVVIPIRFQLQSP
jgi:protein TonB